MEEKRSSGDENAQLFLCLGLPAPSISQGVGARQTRQTHLRQGGGYLDICKATKIGDQAPDEKNRPAADPRLAELRRMGLQRVWLDVAEVIGVDSFLVVWRIIDADPACSYDDTVLRVPMRLYRTYLRYQRDRYIEALSAQGITPSDIRIRLERQMGETLSEAHIRRIAAGK